MNAADGVRVVVYKSAGAKLTVLVKCDLLMDLTPKAAHEKITLLVNGVYMSADADRNFAVQARLSALVEPARDENFIAAAQDDVGDYLLIVRALLGLGTRHELVLGFYDLKELIGVIGYKAVSAGYVLFDFFALYN